jgi:hypothetical protein
MLMRFRVLAVIAAIAALSLVVASTASAGSASTPDRHAPRWFTKKFQKKLRKADERGIELSNERLNTACPGVQTGPGVQANGCIVTGCTANFIFTDGTSKYIGTARHCSDGVGTRIAMQVDTTTVADIGTVVKQTPGDGVPGNDFALIKIDADVVQKWGVDPAIPVVGGPNGVYTGCGPEAIKFYGHGYAAAVGQGKPGGGLATNWNNDGFGWTGSGLPGDSGSGVVTSTGQAAGDLTHLIVDLGTYPASNMAGMRATAILRFLGGGYSIVNADGSTSRADTTNCTSGLPF